MANTIKRNDKYEYRPMTAGELARAIDETGVSLSQFCRLLDLDYDWVRDDLLKSGRDEIPHVVRLVCLLLQAAPNGVSLARQLTDAVLIGTTDAFDPEQKRENAGRHGKESGFTVERKRPSYR